VEYCYRVAVSTAPDRNLFEGFFFLGGGGRVFGGVWRRCWCSSWVPAALGPCGPVLLAVSCLVISFDGQDATGQADWYFFVLRVFNGHDRIPVEGETCDHPDVWVGFACL